MPHPPLERNHHGTHPQANGPGGLTEYQAPTGAGLRFTGAPTFEFSARRWTSEDLDAARHTTDLAARDRIYVNLDLAQHGIGSASCGPGVLPEHRLTPRPGAFSLVFMPITRATIA